VEAIIHMNEGFAMDLSKKKTHHRVMSIFVF